MSGSIVSCSVAKLYMLYKYSVELRYTQYLHTERTTLQKGVVSYTLNTSWHELFTFKYTIAMIVEQMSHNYVVLPPTQADLTGFKVGSLMRTRGVISGSDLGINSRWTVVSKKGNVFTYRSVESPQTVWVWTGQIMDLQTIFNPQTDENYQA